MLEFLIALSGILFGYLLTYIAPEEIEKGKRYFSVLQKILISIIAGLQLLFFVQARNTLLGLLFFFVFSVTFFLALKKEPTTTGQRPVGCSPLRGSGRFLLSPGIFPHNWGRYATSPRLGGKFHGFYRKHFLTEIVNYITFLVLLALVSQKEAQLLLASMIFLYGLPTGTLIAHEFRQRFRRSH